MDPQALAEQRIGTTLSNKWKLEKLLGVGGMAAVYLGVHKIGRREAIKILHPEVARAPEIRARFEQEAHAVNRFRHPGVVEIRDIDVTEDGAPFLVMELLEGESLADRAARLGGIEIAELLRLVDELLDVLVAAHAQEIVHRDIKLDNLFVRSDGHLKILDFGIARVRDFLPAEMRTRIGATLGTATYMPPEQIMGLDVDGRADIYAIGATMFRIIARRRIHEAGSEPEMLIKMATQPAPPLGSVASGVPRDVALVVDRALMFERDRRYPDAVTMQGDIRALREGRSPPYAARFSDAPTRAGGDAPISAPTSGAAVPASGPTVIEAPGARSPATPVPATPMPATPMSYGPASPSIAARMSPVPATPMPATPASYGPASPAVATPTSYGPASTAVPAPAPQVVVVPMSNANTSPILLGSESTMLQPLTPDMVALPRPLPTAAGSVGVGATAPPAGAMPGGRTVATGPRAQIAGGIGTELNQPTHTAGGGRAIGLPAQGSARSGIPVPILVVSAVVLVLGIGGTLFCVLHGGGDSPDPAPAVSSTSGQGHGPRPAVRRPAKAP